MVNAGVKKGETSPVPALLPWTLSLICLSVCQLGNKFVDEAFVRSPGYQSAFSPTTWHCIGRCCRYLMSAYVGAFGWKCQPMSKASLSQLTLNAICTAVWTDRQKKSETDSDSCLESVETDTSFSDRNSCFHKQNDKTWTKVKFRYCKQTENWKRNMAKSDSCTEAPMTVSEILNSFGSFHFRKGIKWKSSGKLEFQLCKQTTVYLPQKMFGLFLRNRKPMICAVKYNSVANVEETSSPKPYITRQNDRTHAFSSSNLWHLYSMDV